jgi:hypothetical protein
LRILIYKQHKENAMKKTVQAFVFMEHCFPVDDTGATAWNLPRVWTPKVWRNQVEDAEDRLFVSQQSVEVEVPDDFNPIPAQVAAIEAQKAAVLAEYQHSVAMLNAQLSKLLAITNEVQA